MWILDYIGPEMAATSGNKKWKHMGAIRLREFKTMKPICEMGVKKVEEMKKKKQYWLYQDGSKNMHYNVTLTKSDQDLFDLTYKHKVPFPLYDNLEQKLKHKKPCRAALLWQESTHDLN